MNVIGAVFSLVLGAVMSSFAGVVIDRIPKKMSIVKPGSHCDNCGMKIAWYDNIPILSYLILKGRCRHCKQKIKPFHFWIEVIGSIGFLLVFLQFRYDLRTVLGFYFVFLFLVIGGIDFLSREIYDFTLIMFLIGSIAYPIGLKIYDHSISLWEYGLGGFIGFTIFFLIRVISGRIKKQESLGMGDVYLAGIMGLLLGPKLLLPAITIGSVLGAVIALIVKIFRKDLLEVPFAPFLLTGTFCAFLWGEAILKIFH